MKARSTTCIIAILLTYGLYCQNVEWARKDTVSPDWLNQIICVKDSSVFLYGTIHWNGESFLTKYTAQGTFVSTKIWPGNFLIKKLIYDGGQYFYFTAVYQGNLTVDGIPLIGKGGTDAVVGAMKIDGTVQWMSNIASAADESLNGICFGPLNSIVVTGKTTDSLIVNGTFITKSTQSTLFAKFSKSGVLLTSRLWDFLPQRNNFFGTEGGLQNEGLNIHFTSASYSAPDHYYILTTREGKHSPCCSNDTLNAPLDGYYVMKLNAAWDTLWTTYIISHQCYYGYDIGDIAVPVNDDVYVPSYCNLHYGGTGLIQRLDRYTGAASWSDSHSDGGYKYIVAEGNKIYSCGTDSATYCPCPSMWDGFQTLKVFDQLNTMTHIKKFNQAAYGQSGLEFIRIARDGHGHSYVYGTHTSSVVVLGTDSIKGTQYVYTWYLMKLSDTTAVSGLRTQSVSQFVIYPNPAANGCFELNTGKLSGLLLSLNVKSVDGQIVHSEIIPAGQKHVAITIKNCNRGVYIVELSNGKEIRRDKLIIE
jgi:hypothetical protein